MSGSNWKVTTECFQLHPSGCFESLGSIILYYYMIVIVVLKCVSEHSLAIPVLAVSQGRCMLAKMTFLIVCQI